MLFSFPIADSKMAAANRYVKAENVHCESVCSDGFTAQIPWLPKREQTIPFKRSAFSRLLLTDLKVRHRVQAARLNLNETLAESFPFYLPARYHTMDVLEMQKRAKAPGSYWTNAIHFFRTCSDFGTIPFYDMSSGPLDKENILIKGKDCKFGELKKEGGPEQCETAAEFLLEPWVVLQLPFQPALLHQWIVGAMAFTLQFKKNLVELATRGLAPGLEVFFKQLCDLSMTLSTKTNLLLTKFFEIYCNNPEESLHAKINKFYKGKKDLQEVLGVLDFVLSEDCNLVINFLKSKSWSRDVAPTDLQDHFDSIDTILDPGDAKQNNVYYNCQGVLKNAYIRIPFKPKTTTFTLKNFTDMRDSTVNFHNDIVESEELCAKIKQFVGDEILDISSPLKGLKNKKEFVSNLDQLLSPMDLLLLKYYVHHLETLKDYDFRAPEVEKGGILLDIMVLEAALKAEGLVGQMTNIIWKAAKQFDNDVYLEANLDPFLPALSIEDLESKINLTYRQKQWSLDSVWDRVLAETSDDEDAQNFASFANVARMTLKKLLLTMYKQQYLTIEKEDFLFHPECLFVHYIIPCFVAMLIDLAEVTSLDVKTSYAEFVFKTIASYQKHFGTETLSKVKKQKFNGRYNFDGDLNNHLNTLTSTLKTVFEDHPSMLNIVEKFRLIVLYNKTAVIPISKNPTVAQKVERYFELNSTLDSKMMLTRFLCRVLGRDEFAYSQLDLLTTINVLTNNETLSIVKTLKQRLAQKSKSVHSAGKNCTELTVAQLFGIAIFVFWNHKMSAESFYSVYQKPLFELDPIDSLANVLLSNDWWKIKSCFATVVNGAQCEDLSLIPINVALHSFHCRQIIKSLDSSKKRVKMNKPGEVTFNPIQHCRWCGLVNAEPFRLCAECKDEPGFPHPNYFCSEECEKTLMDDCHAEEHARFVMEKLGIS